MNDKITKIFSSIGVAIFLLILAIALLVISLLKSPDNSNSKAPNNNASSTANTEVVITGANNNASSTATELTDFGKYKSYKKASIYPNGYITPNDYINNDKNALIKAGHSFTATGTIADAYIYVRAGANNESGNYGPIIKQWDSIWFYFMDGLFKGGHLDLSKSIFGETSNLTELLYNLKNIPMAANLTDYRQNKFITFNILKDLNKNRFVGALVSTQRYGKIEELTVGYKCADNSDCQIIVK